MNLTLRVYCLAVGASSEILMRWIAVEHVNTRMTNTASIKLNVS